MSHADLAAKSESSDPPLKTSPQASRTPMDLLFPEPAKGRISGAMRNAAMRIAGVRRVLECVESVRRKGFEGRFLLGVLKEFGIRWNVVGGTAQSIPQSGPLIVVANHPFGAAEGMILHELVHAQRPDLRTMAIFQLRMVPELDSEFIFVDAVNSVEARRGNVRPLAETVRWLERGGALAMFPAGAISQYSFHAGRTVDTQWLPLLGGLVRRSGATVLPVFFHGVNSLHFRAIGSILPRIATMLVVREILNKRGRTIPVSIGEPVEAAELLALGSDHAISTELRRRTYALANDERLR